MVASLVRRLLFSACQGRYGCPGAEDAVCRCLWHCACVALIPVAGTIRALAGILHRFPCTDSWLLQCLPSVVRVCICLSEGLLGTARASSGSTRGESEGPEAWCVVCLGSCCPVSLPQGHTLGHRFFSRSFYYCHTYFFFF